MKRLLFFAILASLSSGCKKHEGSGGTSNIRGRVYVIDFKDDLVLKPDTMPALEKDVYIKYGLHDIIDDKSTTNQDGEYGFDYLRTGDYHLIAYSKNPEQSGVDTPIVKTITISGKNTTVQVPNIYIYKAKSGYASITGRVFVKDYNATMKPKNPVDNYYGGGEDVYLQKIGSSDILKKETTNYDGTFVFKRLLKGKYKVFAYSKDTIPIADSTEFSSTLKPSFDTCIIETVGQQLLIHDIVIIK